MKYYGHKLICNFSIYHQLTVTIMKTCVFWILFEWFSADFHTCCKVNKFVSSLKYYLFRNIIENHTKNHSKIKMTHQLTSCLFVLRCYQSESRTIFSASICFYPYKDVKFSISNYIFLKTWVNPFKKLAVEYHCKKEFAK